MAEQILQINQSRPGSTGSSACSRHRPLVVLSQVWSLKLEQEVEKNKALTEALQILAAEQQELKESLRSSRRSSASRTLTEEDFYDALSGQPPRTPDISLRLRASTSSGRYSCLCRRYSAHEKIIDHRYAFAND